MDHSYRVKCPKCHRELIIHINEAKAREWIVCTCEEEIKSWTAIAEELILGINNKDPIAMEHFILIFDREIRTVIYRFLRQWHSKPLAAQEIEDGVYDLYGSLWQRGIKGIRIDLTSYVRGMAYKKAIDIMRRREDRMYAHVPFKEEEISDAKTVNNEYYQALLMDLGKATASLSEEKQIAFELYYLEGWPLKEIAAVLKADIAAVKSSIYRALRDVENFLKGRGY